MRPRHNQKVTSAGFVLTRTESTRMNLSKRKEKKGFGKAFKRESGSDKKQLDRDYFSREASCDLMVDYKSSFPDEESVLILVAFRVLELYTCILLFG